MNNNTGVYTTTKKNGDTNYRASITFKGKHISLGSYSSYDFANKAYQEAKTVISNKNFLPEDYPEAFTLPHEKYICLINFINNGLYFPTPIYLRKQYFEYYLNESHILKFDRDDLFFYASHKIQQRGGYLFVSDYGSQYKLLSRYGVKPFAVYGRDYVMVNQDKNDYRYSNIRILSNYTGVIPINNGFKAVIHINGNYNIGFYDTEIYAAIAYNKAVDTLHANGLSKAYLKNYIVSLNKEEYLKIYDSITIPDKITSLQ